MQIRRRRWPTPTAVPQQSNPADPPPVSTSQPTPAPTPWKTIFITAAVSGTAVYLVSKIFTVVEKKFTEQPQQPALPPGQPQMLPPPQMQPQPVQQQQAYGYPAQTPPMPSYMQPYGYAATQAPAPVVMQPVQPVMTPSGLTETDLHAWSHELQTREDELERRESVLKAEQKRLRLVS